MAARRNIVVEATGAPRARARIEMCEHKGIGHPDTIADAVCEAVALALTRDYEASYGHCIHFNVDKGLLVGGRSEPRFGGGEVIERPKLTVCGRGSNPEGRLDMGALVRGAAAGWLDANLAPGSSFFEISSEVKEGSANLREVFGLARVRANDTSFGVGYAPLSALELKVKRLARALGAPALREAVPAAGQDFKVMGLREGGAFAFTIAIALIDRHVRNCRAYFEAKEEIRRLASAALDAGDGLHVNRLDDPDATNESGIYLTVTGLSAEMGDDGQVGRGNRVNGLITPGRAMSLEAAAGKNPYAHVGKIYNVLAHRIAARICERLPETGDVCVQLLSEIGRPVDDPQVAAVEIGSSAGPALLEAVRALVDAEFDALPDLLSDLAHGRVPVY